MEQLSECCNAELVKKAPGSYYTHICSRCGMKINLPANPTPKQDGQDCYCVCHTSTSSCAYCEHCKGDNEVGRYWKSKQDSLSECCNAELVKIPGFDENSFKRCSQCRKTWAVVHQLHTSPTPKQDGQTMTIEEILANFQTLSIQNGASPAGLSFASGELAWVTAAIEAYCAERERLAEIRGWDKTFRMSGTTYAIDLLTEMDRSTALIPGNQEVVDMLLGEEEKLKRYGAELQQQSSRKGEND